MDERVQTRRGGRALWWVIALAVAAVIALGIALVAFWGTPANAPGLEDERRRCEAEGGEWVEFPNAGPRCSLPQPTP